MARTTDWTPDEMKALLNPSTVRGCVAIESAVLSIYARQTASEQEVGETTESNGVGFSGCDADILSSFAQWIARSRHEPGDRLTGNQMRVAGRKIAKYSRQLCEIANAKLVGKRCVAESLARCQRVPCPECRGSGRVEVQENGEWCEVPCSNGCADYLSGAVR